MIVRKESNSPIRRDGAKVRKRRVSSVGMLPAEGFMINRQLR
jgi:hypothetical protein